MEPLLKLSVEVIYNFVHRCCLAVEAAILVTDLRGD